MKLTQINAAEAPKAVGAYSQAIAAGDLIFCSGQIPLDPASGEIVPGDIKVQTARVLDNLAAVLAAAGSGLEGIAKATVFLVDMNDFAAFNEVYAQRLGTHRPARATVAVVGLPRGVRVEIECVAVRL